MTDRDRLHHIIAGLIWVAIVAAIAAWQAWGASHQIIRPHKLMGRVTAFCSRKQYGGTAWESHAMINRNGLIMTIGMAVITS